MSVNSGLKAIQIIGQRKAFYRQRIPKSSCAKKETVDIDILVTSRNGDRNWLIEMFCSFFQFIWNQSICFFLLSHLKYCWFFLSFLLSSSLLLICQKSLQSAVLDNFLVLWLAAFLCCLLFLVLLWFLLSTCRGHLLFDNILESFYLMNTLVIHQQKNLKN